MATPTLIEVAAAILFALAVAHTLATTSLTRLSHHFPRHAGLFHLLGEVEVVFGFWAFLLVAAMFALSGQTAAIEYVNGRDFTEALFVLAIMVIAASRPILQAVLALVHGAARWTPLPRALAVYFLCLSLVPLLGSFITEPAAMTLAAIMLRDAYFSKRLSARLQYATLGVLFVNVSIGGTLTPFAAPPVLMVAGKWQWDTAFMMANFGWRSALAVLFNAAVVTLLFRREIADTGSAGSAGPDDVAATGGTADRATGPDAASPEADANATVGQAADARPPVPLAVTIVHLAFLVGVVFFSHHAVVFMALFLFFLGFTEAYQRYQDRLMLREGLLVAFFLAGLITLGGLQKWWLQPLLSGVDETVLFFVATGLTAITDNAALTYLGSLVEGLTAEHRYALVAGAVAGGGLTVIANAPNPAGFSILKGHFLDETISPFGLLVAAIPPTVVAAAAFLLL